MEINILVKFFNNFCRGDKLYDFLFAFLGTELLRGQLEGRICSTSTKLFSRSKLLPYKEDPIIDEGGKNISETVNSPVPVTTI